MQSSAATQLRTNYMLIFSARGAVCIDIANTEILAAH